MGGPKWVVQNGGVQNAATGSDRYKCSRTEISNCTDRTLPCCCRTKHGSSDDIVTGLQNGRMEKS